MSGVHLLIFFEIPERYTTVPYCFQEFSKFDAYFFSVELRFLPGFRQICDKYFGAYFFNNISTTCSGSVLVGVPSDSLNHNLEKLLA